MHIGVETAEGAARMFGGGWLTVDGVEWAWGEVLELKIPFKCIGAKAGLELTFFVEVTAAGRAPERYPRTSPLQLTVPPENAQEYEWMA